MKEKIAELVCGMRGEAVGICSDLVKINTVNPYAGDPRADGELKGQEYLAERLIESGLEVKMFEPPEDVYQQAGILGPSERSFEERPVVVGEKQFGSGGKTIILNSHMDTVGTGNMKIDPFGGEIRDGKIWGRGSSDSKGGLTAALIAVRALMQVAESQQLSGKICFESVVDEESSGSGAGTLACCLEGYSGDFALVADGGYMGIACSCTGVITSDILVEGKSGHAASGGVSAIDKGIVIKEAIDGFKAEREADDPRALVNLGIFEAGEHASVVPGRARLSMNAVYTWDETRSDEDGRAIRRKFEEKIRRCEKGDDWLRENPSRVEWIKDLPPFRTDQKDPFIRSLAGAYADIKGESPPFREDQAWGDASHLAGVAGMPVVMFGPAQKGVAHGPEEYILIDDILDAASIMALFLYREFQA